MDQRPQFYSLSLSLGNATILNKIKEGYLLWMDISPHMARGFRYTIGTRIENKFLDLLELAYITYFTGRENKTEKIVAQILDETGKMFGGWKNSLNNPEKKNRNL